MRNLTQPMLSRMKGSSGDSSSAWVMRSSASGSRWLRSASV
ncbi:Uncharacterised protein [Bordetella pertussis]|nr:Uncharacterised protein [Bordetella pertussis]